ncbi:hypothetical protein GG344DRAFT_71392 [Lentinula edodes]|nr:hypothetical protein GG344DRAFT_71392 [Lentinula edodes]
MCPFTRFLIAVNLKDSGVFPQWRFRATSAEQILRIQDEFNGDSMQKNMNIFKAITSRQQGLAFNWNIGRSVISIDGFSIVVSSFIDGVYRNFKDVDAATNNSSVAALIPTIFCTLTTQWYFIRPVNRTGSEIDLGRATFNVYFLKRLRTGSKIFGPRPSDRLSRDPKFLTIVGEHAVPKSGAILGWFRMEKSMTRIHPVTVEIPWLELVLDTPNDEDFNHDEETPSTKDEGNDSTKPRFEDSEDDWKQDDDGYEARDDRVTSEAHKS